MLPMIVTQLRKLDLRESFLDSGVLGVITDWLTPLPDRSLPHLQIRENLLKILIEVLIYYINSIQKLKLQFLFSSTLMMSRESEQVELVKLSCIYINIPKKQKKTKN